MGGIQRDLSDAGMAAAIEANLLGVFALMRKWPRAEVHNEPEMLWTITDVPCSWLNMVLRAHLAPDRVDDAIEAVIARGRARSVRLNWYTGPSTRPADLGTSLEKHGFVNWGGQAGMAIDFASLSGDVAMPPGLAIERVRDVDAAHTWCHALVTGFEAPDAAEVEAGFLDWFSRLGFGAEAPALYYIGRQDGEPVATSAVFLVEGVAGIYCVATVPGDRGRGIGTAMTHTALQEAQRRGYRAGILQASDMGEGIYRKLGFREYCRLGEYEWIPGGQQA